MKTILFKGKCKDNGEWIEGHLVKLGRESFSDPERYGICNKAVPLGGSGVCCNLKIDEVIPETVGQFTGLTDMNGKKIFEGDIVSTKYKLGRGHYYVFEVYYNENLCHFALTINRGSYTKNKQYDWLQLTSLKANKVEVIGNIHDNAELLKGNVE